MDWILSEDAELRMGAADDDRETVGSIPRSAVLASDDLRQQLSVVVTAHEVLAENLDGLERMALARAERATEKLVQRLDRLDKVLREFSEG